MSRIELTAVGLALGAALAWGAWGFLSDRASVRAAPLTLWVTVVLVEAIAVIPVAFLIRPAFSWLTIAAGLAGTIGYALFFLALRRGSNAAPLIAITALYPAVTLILQVIITRVQLHPRQVVGLALAIIAIALIAL
ncbi:EamA family transporter [Ferrimicrobium sp.]|uniref:EamA family transporter n=1 Tax=Ferrimicrobium sp. TaxID=2926050 RepID=UPI0026174533|nr:EamA family transporter [Ferrimicrobium sp.]